MSMVLSNKVCLNETWRVLALLVTSLLCQGEDFVSAVSLPNNVEQSLPYDNTI